MQTGSRGLLCIPRYQAALSRVCQPDPNLSDAYRTSSALSCFQLTHRIVAWLAIRPISRPAQKKYFVRMLRPGFLSPHSSGVHVSISMRKISRSLTSSHSVCTVTMLPVRCRPSLQAVRLLRFHSLVFLFISFQLLGIYIAATGPAMAAFSPCISVDCFFLAIRKERLLQVARLQFFLDYLPSFRLKRYRESCIHATLLL